MKSLFCLGLLLLVSVLIWLWGKCCSKQGPTEGEGYLLFWLVVFWLFFFLGFVNYLWS